jgi:hypothetical protein
MRRASFFEGAHYYWRICALARLLGQSAIAKTAVGGSV